MTFSDAGLILNVIGTLLVAFAFGKLPRKQGGYTEIENGKGYEFSYLLSPRAFWTGVTLIIIGFVLQLSLIKSISCYENIYGV